MITSFFLCSRTNNIDEDRVDKQSFLILYEYAIVMYPFLIFNPFRVHASPGKPYGYPCYELTRKVSCGPSFSATVTRVT